MSFKVNSELLTIQALISSLNNGTGNINTDEITSENITSTVITSENLIVTGGTPGSGRILTDIDGNGTASWEPVGEVASFNTNEVHTWTANQVFTNNISTESSKINIGTSGTLTTGDGGTELNMTVSDSAGTVTNLVTFNSSTEEQFRIVNNTTADTLEITTNDSNGILLDNTGGVEVNTSLKCNFGTLGSGNVLTDVNGDGEATWETAAETFSSGDTHTWSADQTFTAGVELSSNLKCNFSTLGSGKVLTDVNGDGDATWVDPVFNNGNISNGNSTIGLNALSSITTGTNNTAFGDSAAFAITEGSDNVGIGYQALTANTTGAFNVAIGSAALTSLTTGVANIGIGLNAGTLITNGGTNIAIGHRSLDTITTQDSNVAIGSACLTNATSSENTGVGATSLQQTTSGNSNVAIGFAAGKANTTGIDNVYVGHESGLDGDASNNVGIGNSALQVISGNDNVAIGSRVGYALTTASQNVLIGSDSYGTNSCVDNVVIGYSTNIASATVNNVVIGSLAFASDDGNVVIGKSATSDTYSGCICIGEGATAIDNNTLALGSVVTEGSAISTETITDRLKIKIGTGEYYIALYQ